MKSSSKILVLLALLIWLAPAATAQKDSVFTDSLGREIKIIKKEKWSRAEKAGLLSAALPGMGQIYNKKYWKAPIVWVGSAALLTYTLQTHGTYREVRDAFEANDWEANPSLPATLADTPVETEGQYRTLRDQLRRQRDYFIILSSAFYAINIVDAVVDAHLSEFDLSDELSLKINPQFSPVNDKFAAGVAFSFNLK